ncbi:hypothetical protein QC764_500260 [Podospora pseudoanserina]|uniref:Uncharacterized protein n=1 Tax=Podospora pseudoanserina TaxID=2609844 RepID=A0ABR0I4N6_9PEZI|nr:hypothetical protein QC764_500260 [Podospora pseudoanserina]
MGISITAFAGNDRELRRRDALSSRLSGRDIKIETRTPIDEVIVKSQFDLDRAEEMGAMIGPEFDKPRPARKQLRKRATEGGILNPEALIQSPAYTLRAESLELAFPWLFLQQLCWTLLLEPVKIFHKRSGAAKVHETDFPLLVGNIFMAAEGLDGSSDGEPNMVPMKAAAIYFNKMLSDTPDLILVGLRWEWRMPIDSTFEGSEEIRVDTVGSDY